jgi:ELWxxDGT repeat protein
MERVLFFSYVSSAFPALFHLTVRRIVIAAVFICCSSAITFAGHAEMVKDICRATLGSQPQYLTEANNLLFFNAYHKDYGSELWVSYGTCGETRLVKDIVPGQANSVTMPLATFNGLLYFAAKHSSQYLFDLWVTDGTEAGTRIFKQSDLVRIWTFGSKNMFRDALLHLL